MERLEHRRHSAQIDARIKLGRFPHEQSADVLFRAGRHTAPRDILEGSTGVPPVTKNLCKIKSRARRPCYILRGTL